jgi:GT2 family glycosyltransferase
MKSTTKLDLSIVIVSWNVRDLLHDCLQSVFRAAEGMKFEVFVVDNASHDGSPEMVARDFPDVRLIANQQNLGFGMANNQALRACSGKYVLLLNPDTVVPRQAIHKMVEFMEKHPSAGLIGPEQRDGKGRLKGNFVHIQLRELFEYLIERVVSVRRDHTRILFSRPRCVLVLNAGCWMVRRRAIFEIGMFDEDLFMYAEEPDVCHRMRLDGWQIWFVRDVEIIHYRRESIRQKGKIIELALFSQSMVIWIKKIIKSWIANSVGGPAS